MHSNVTAYLHFMSRMNYSPLTITKHRYFLERFAADVKVQPERVTYAEIVAFVDRVGTGLTPKTRSNQIGLLRSFGRYLQEEEDVAFTGRNPFLRLRAPKVPRRVVRAPEAAALVEAFKTVTFLRHLEYDANNSYIVWMAGRNKLLCLSFAIYGARNAELSNLQWRDVRLSDNSFVILKGKGDKERFVPLFPELARLYAAHKLVERERERGDSNDYVFVAHRHNNPNNEAKPMHTQTVRDTVRDVLAGRVPDFDRVTPQVLRRAALTALIEGGTDIVTVAGIAGHNSINTTFNHYFAQRDKRKEVALANSPMAECVKLETNVLRKGVQSV